MLQLAGKTLLVGVFAGPLLPTTVLPRHCLPAGRPLTMQDCRKRHHQLQLAESLAACFLLPPHRVDPAWMTC